MGSRSLIVLALFLGGCLYEESPEEGSVAAVKLPQPVAPVPVTAPEPEPEAVSVAVAVQQQVLEGQHNQADELADELAEIRRHLLQERLQKREEEADAQGWKDTPPKRGTEEWDRYQEWLYLLQHWEALKNLYDHEALKERTTPEQRGRTKVVFLEGSPKIEVEGKPDEARPEAVMKPVLKPARKPKPKRKKPKAAFGYEPGWKR